jgi:prevent-host-death family protein
MDVPVSNLRAHLRHWLQRARQGDEVVITDRGLPVARLLGVGASATLDRLTAAGVIGRPEQSERPRASGRSRPRAQRSLAGLVTEQRR